ncbi:MAG: bifunctional biotin--[acetyl-CoA-carboxylase] ligase/biotin operon repressor BirA [Acidiferrobacterales bacterium]
MTTKHDLLSLLSDGNFHSGTDMGAKLGVSRAAINKAIKSLSHTGIDIHRVSGRGYRLAEPMRPLDKQAILGFLPRLGEGYGDRLHLFDEIDSTSNFLSALSASEFVLGVVCIAEVQSGGRGRRGRSWVSTPYRNIMMSMSWQFDNGPASVAGLSLAAGVAVVKALREFGIDDIGLKWPNDIIWHHRKIAGLLLDVQGEASGPSRVVLGLGLNVSIGEKDAQNIDQSWVDMRTIIDEVVDRNRLVAMLVIKLEDMFTRFESSGLSAFEQDWQAVHVFHGQTVRLLRGNEVIVGIAEGIDGSGALKLRNASGRINFYHSGEVSLRAVECETAD